METPEFDLATILKKKSELTFDQAKFVYEIVEKIGKETRCILNKDLNRQIQTADFENIIQESRRRIEEYKGHVANFSNPEGWIFTIIYNAGLDYFEKRGKIETFEKPEAIIVSGKDGEEKKVVVGGVVNPEKIEDVLDSKALLNILKKNKKLKYYEVIELKLEDMEDIEIAKKLGITKNNVYHRYFLAIKYLQGYLKIEKVKEKPGGKSKIRKKEGRAVT